MLCVRFLHIKHYHRDNSYDIGCQNKNIDFHNIIVFDWYTPTRNILVTVRVYLSLSSLLRDLRERAKREPWSLNGEIVNKYTINSLVSDLFSDRQRM